MTRWFTMGAMLVALGIASACEKSPPGKPPAEKPMVVAEPEPIAATTAAESLTAEPLCPVTGDPIDKQFVERFRGKWVYFSNHDARQKFVARPYDYTDGLQAQWQAYRPLRVQVKCPVTGETVDPSIYAGRGEDAIHFANENAKAKWQADSTAYRSHLGQKCYTFQTLCAHSSRPIDPAVSREIDGRTLYFFCPSCAAAFEQESASERAHLLKEIDALIDRNQAAWNKR